VSPVYATSGMRTSRVTSVAGLAQVADLVAGPAVVLLLQLEPPVPHDRKPTDGDGVRGRETPWMTVSRGDSSISSPGCTPV